MTDTVAPEPTPEQAALIARVRRMMLIAGLTSALAVAVVLLAVGYRLYRGEGSPAARQRGHYRNPAQGRPHRLDGSRRRTAGADTGYRRRDRNPHLRRQNAEAGRKAEIRQRTLINPHCRHALPSFRGSQG